MIQLFGLDDGHLVPPRHLLGTSLWKTFIPFMNSLCNGIVVSRISAGDAGCYLVTCAAAMLTIRNVPSRINTL